MFRVEFLVLHGNISISICIILSFIFIIETNSSLKQNQFAILNLLVIVLDGSIGIKVGMTTKARPSNRCITDAMQGLHQFFSRLFTSLFLLLMAEISNNHLGWCWNPKWDIYHINWCRISAINRIISYKGQYFFFQTQHHPKSWIILFPSGHPICTRV